MKNRLTLILASLTTLVAGVAVSATTIENVVASPTNYFAPAGQEASSPYYRYADGDWEWAHSAISTLNITAAVLSLGSWDADYVSGEIDNIFVKHNGNWELLGPVQGTDGDSDYAAGFATTSFVLDGKYFTDVAAGLQLRIDIDSTQPPGQTYWAMSLTSSKLTVRGEPKTPGVPDNGSSLLLVGAGLAALAGLARRFRK